MTLYRLYLKKPKGSTTWSQHKTELVDGEAERDRWLARPRPKVIYCEAAVIWTCATCGASGPWSDSWSFFGCDADLDEGVDVLKFCGEACIPVDLERRPKREEGQDYREWRHLYHFEPIRDRMTRWKILRDADQAPTAHRKVPMPEWPGPGSCRWCLKPTYYESGKKKGQPAERNWHNACYYQYRLHTELAAQFDFLFDRDGPRCQICGAGGYARDRNFTVQPPDGEDLGAWMDRTGRGGAVTYLKPSIALDVDHVIPLWKVVRMFPPGTDLTRYYGPVNLWLICGPCHKRKSADEAAERAALKRRG